MIEKNFNEIRDQLISRLENLNYPTDTLDLSDLGNEIGIIVGHYLDKESLGFDKDAFTTGLDHGFSITDGTH